MDMTVIEKEINVCEVCGFESLVDDQETADFFYYNVRLDEIFYQVICLDCVWQINPRFVL